MKSIKRISVVFLLLFSIIINNTGGCAKVYNEWKHYYTFEGKLKRGKEQTTMNHGIEVTAFVL
ncbi:MAG: hypothetical protein J5819_02580, partial [Eubacterium sp.]|nr:hypothetical protein [Eubacterium sp.]